MLVHLLAHAIKHAQAAVSNRRLKQVVCEKCHAKYWYFLSRTGIGKASYFILADSSAAKARAQVAAQRNVEKRLDRESEAVPCPECHWINEELVKQLRRRQYRRMSLLAVPLLILGAAAFPITYFIADSSREYSGESQVLAIGISGGFIVAAIAVFLLRSILRRLINPNRNFPAPPDVAPGTPPALVLTDDGSRLRLADVQYVSGSKYDAWAVLRPGQLFFPRVCCLCLEATADIYRPRMRINENSAGLPVPFCQDCRRRFRGVWLFSALLAIIGASALGAAAIAIPELDDVGRWITGSVIALFGSIIGLFVIPNWLCRPYRYAIVDGDRGIVKFAAKNEEFTRLLIEQVRHREEMDASAQRPI